MFRTYIEPIGALSLTPTVHKNLALREFVTSCDVNLIAFSIAVCNCNPLWSSARTFALLFPLAVRGPAWQKHDPL